MRSKFMPRCIGALLLLLLTGCGAATGSAPPPIAQLTVQLVNGAANPTVFTTRHVSQQRSSQQLYQVLLSYPRVTSETNTCPWDKGFRYHLLFQDRSGVILYEATVSPTGCRFATLGKIKTHGSDVRRIPDSFWPLFARTLGVPLQQVFDPPGFPEPKP